MTRMPTVRLDTATLPEFVRYFNNNTIGFEDMVSKLTKQESSNYPPYNMLLTGEDTYEITMAVAGFKKDEVEIAVNNRELTITGQRTLTEMPEGHEILHQGLAMRDFSRVFKLAEYVEITGAAMEDGILTVKLARIIPDAAKPKLISIE